MLTAIIRSRGEIEPLAATLTVLIAAVSEGFVGHAVVVVPVADSETETLADATGAAYVVASADKAWQAGVAAARGEWVLLLDAGDIPDVQWTRVVEHHLLLDSQTPALLPLYGFFDRLAERCRRLVNPRALGPGIMTTRQQGMTGALDRTVQRLRSPRRQMPGSA